MCPILNLTNPVFMTRSVNWIFKNITVPYLEQNLEVSLMVSSRPYTWDPSKGFHDSNWQNLHMFWDFHLRSNSLNPKKNISKLLRFFSAVIFLYTCSYLLICYLFVVITISKLLFLHSSSTMPGGYRFSVPFGYFVKRVINRKL